jgi:taurine dioxygenase
MRSRASLYQQVENPYFNASFRWTENAIVFWNDPCAQHRAMWDDWPIPAPERA